MSAAEGLHNLGPLHGDEAMDPLHEQLLQQLEAGQIHPQEMQQFQAANRDATVNHELMWILFSIEQLEKHRLRLVEHLRTLGTDP